MTVRENPKPKQPRINERDVTLHDGRVVSNYSREWMQECEARHLLTLPLWKRREQLDAMEKKRGCVSVNKLKEVMQQLHAKRKSVA